MKIKFEEYTPRVMKEDILHSVANGHTLSEYLDYKLRNFHIIGCREITLYEIAKFGTKSNICKEQFSITYTFELHNNDIVVTRNANNLKFKPYSTINLNSVIKKNDKRVVKFLDKYSKYILEAFGKKTISFEENLVCSDVWHINARSWLDNKEK